MRAQRFFKTYYPTFYAWWKALSHRVRRQEAGVTLIELLTVFLLVGVMTTMALPSMKFSGNRKARHEARLLARDLELARIEAMAKKAEARIVFNTSTDSYQVFVADTLIRTRVLENSVAFGQGGAGNVPGITGSGAVTLSGSELRIGPRGIPLPMGTRGAIYLVRDEGQAAVSIAGSGSFRTWTYMDGAWK